MRAPARARPPAGGHRNFARVPASQATMRVLLIPCLPSPRSPQPPTPPPSRARAARSATRQAKATHLRVGHRDRRRRLPGPDGEAGAPASRPRRRLQARPVARVRCAGQGVARVEISLTRARTSSVTVQDVRVAVAAVGSPGMNTLFFSGTPDFTYDGGAGPRQMWMWRARAAAPRSVSAPAPTSSTVQLDRSIGSRRLARDVRRRRRRRAATRLIGGPGADSLDGGTGSRLARGRRRRRHAHGRPRDRHRRLLELHLAPTMTTARSR